LSDIQITSELTLDLQQMQDQLRRALSDFQSFADQVNQTKLGPSAAFDANLMQQQWNQFTSNLQPIQVKLDLTNAQQQWNQWVSGLGGAGISINVVNAPQIGFDIGQAVSTSLLNSASVIGQTIGNAISASITSAGGGGGGVGGGTFAAWNPATGQAVPLAYDPGSGQFFNTQNGMAMAGVNWPGSGGGGGQNQPQNTRLARAVMGMYMMRRIANAIRSIDEAQSAEAVAYTPMEHVHAAERVQQSLERGVEAIPVIGPIATAGWEILTSPVSAENKIIEKQAETGIRFAEMQDKASTSLRDVTYQNKIRQSGGLEKALLQAQMDKDRRNDELMKQSKESREEVDRLNKLDESEAGVGQGWFGQRNLFSGSESVYNEWWDKNFGGNFTEQSRLSRTQTATERQRAVDAMSKAKKDANDEAFRRATEEAVDNEEVAKQQHVNEILGIRAGMDVTELSMSGQGRAAREKSLQNSQTRKLWDIETEQLEAANKGDIPKYRRLELLHKTTEDENDLNLRQFNQKEDVEERFANRSANERIANTVFRSDVSNLRAQGKTTEAGNIEFKHSLDEQIQLLQDKADKYKLIDINVSNAALAEKKALEESRQGLIDDRAAMQSFADNMKDWEIVGKTRETGLRTQGRSYEAGQQAIADQYNQRIAEVARNDPATARLLEQQKQSALRQYEHQHDLGIRDINEESTELEMRNRGDTRGASLEHLKYEHQKELEENANDPIKRAAILRRQVAETQSFIRGAAGSADDPRGVWFNLLGQSTFGGNTAGGANAQAQLNIEQKHLQEELQKKKQADDAFDKLKHGLGGLFDNPVGSALGSLFGGGNGPQAADLHGAMDKLDAFGAASKALTAAAKKIVDSAPLYTVGG